MCMDVTEWINKKYHPGAREMKNPVSITVDVMF